MTKPRKAVDWLIRDFGHLSWCLNEMIPTVNVVIEQATPFPRQFDATGVVYAQGHGDVI